MSKKSKDIKKAQKYLGRGEYTKIIRLLEAKVPLYVENKEFYYILAQALFYTGDYSGAKLYFDRGQKIHWDVDSSLFLATLGLKRRDYNSALRIWLDILDEYPENKLARKGLALLKKYSTMDELDFFIHSKKIEKLIPKRKVKLSPITIAIMIVAIISLGIGFVAVKSDLPKIIKDKFLSHEVISNNANREGSEQFNLVSMNDDYVDFSNQSIYSFSGEQIEEFFSISSELFINNKDNRVRTYLNLIKYSNANSLIKKKAELLDSYLVDPEWSSYSDDISFRDVDQDLYKYENCVVKWKGKLSNHEIKNKKIYFSLLVGYDSGKVLEGVVPVELNDNIKIQENQPIEVLGKIILRDESFYIEALTVLQYVIRN